MIHNIPEDLLTVILEYVCTSYPELIKISHVNRSWRSTIRSSPLWLTADDKVLIPWSYVYNRITLGMNRMIVEESNLRAVLSPKRLVCSLRADLLAEYQNKDIHQINPMLDLEKSRSTLTPTMLFDAYITLSSSIHGHLQWYIEWMPLIHRLCHQLEDDLLILIGLFSIPMSFVAYLAITYCVQAAGPINNHLHNHQSKYYWEVAFGLAYVEIIFNILLSFAVISNMILNRLARFAALFYFPWDIAWYPLSVCLFLFGILSILISFHVVFRNGSLDAFGTSAIACGLLPVFPSIIFALLGTFVVLIPRSWLDNSRKSIEFETLENSGVFASVKWVQKNILPRIRTKLLSNYSSQHSAPTEESPQWYFHSQQVFCAMAYLVLWTTIIIPIATAFAIFSNASSNNGVSPHDSRTILGASLPLIIIFAAWACFGVYQAGRKVWELSRSSFEQRPSSCAITMYLLCAVGGVTILLLLVAIVVASITGTSMILSVPALIAAVITCMHPLLLSLASLKER